MKKNIYLIILIGFLSGDAVVAMKRERGSEDDQPSKRRKIRKEDEFEKLKEEIKIYKRADGTYFCPICHEYSTEEPCGFYIHAKFYAMQNRDGHCFMLSKLNHLFEGSDLVRFEKKPERMESIPSLQNDMFVSDGFGGGFFKAEVKDDPMRKQRKKAPKKKAPKKRGKKKNTRRRYPEYYFRIDVQDRRVETWTTPAEVRLRDRQGNVLERRIPITLNRPRRFERENNFGLTICPTIIQRGLDCGLHALFNGVLLHQNDDDRRLNFGFLDETLVHFREVLNQQGLDETNLNFNEVNRLVANDAFFRPVRNGNLSLVPNFSIIHALEGKQGIMAALQTARRYEYETTLEEYNKNEGINLDIMRIMRGENPTILRGGLINDLRVDMIHTLNNIRNFRRTNQPQVIVLHTGGAHWIAVRISHDEEGGDYVEVTDSIESSFDRLQELATKLYMVFRHYELPPVR